jgi:tRNA nucleotidyltransferase (CCA-adding enzyme)
VDHDADMGIQGTGYTAAEAFEQVALGMTAIITDADIRRFSVTIQDHRLQADAWGERVERDRHHPAVEVKDATLTSVDVHQDGEGIWHARCVVDV